ncbi:velvet factor-domain-containing protein [Helicostylum pulchrum]|nr:velvet factor-domain-containing protein [Helicostylum pulchrum]
MTSINIPPPLGLGRPSQKSKKYKLVIIQNPVRARCCGFGEKDRRPIDPPPILQLFIEKPDGSLQNAHEDESNLSLFVVQCDLVSEDGKEQRSHVFNPSSATSPPTSSESVPTTGTLLTFHDPAPTRSLMGAVVSNAYQLMNGENKPGIYFVFQDLSVRIEGRFCLKFMFMNLSAGDPLTMSTQVSDDVLSNPFTVYSAKNFPGMTDSTAVSQCFAQQGIKISIRKGRRIRRIDDRTYDTVTDRQAATPKKNSSSHLAAEEEEEPQKTVYRRIDISTYLTPSS